MLFGKKTSRVLSLSFSLSCKFRVSNETKKKEFGLSLRAHSRSSALFESSGVRPNEDDDDEDKEENG